MKYCIIDLVTEGEHEHTLIVTKDGVITRYPVSSNQLLLLMFRIIATIWSRYRLEPRD